MTPILLLAVFCLLLYQLYKFSQERPKNFPPGPPRLPIWGSYWIVLLHGYRHVHRSYCKLAAKYHTKILGLHLGPIPTVVVNDYENIQQVLTRPEFQARVELSLFNERTYDKNLGVILTNGPFWEQQRRFSLRHLRDSGLGRRYSELENVAEEEIKDVIDLLHGRREDKEIFSNGLALVPQLFYTVVFNLVWYMLTETRFPVTEHDRLRYFTAQAMRHQKSVDITGNAVALTPWLKYFAPSRSGYKDLIESSRNMLKFVENALSDFKTTYSEDYQRNFFDKYIAEINKRENLQEPSGFFEKQLHVIGIDYLFPSATAMASTLAFAMAFLLNYPEVQVKMQQELDAVVGRDRPPTLDDRASLPYNEAVVRETLRCRIVTPLGVVRRATEDTELGGYFIPKDTAVITNLWSFHNDPEFWGDPEVFRPERFLDDDGQLLKKDWSFPFGGGKRVCVGETFSRQYLYLILTSLLQGFSVKPDPGNPLPKTEEDLPGIIMTKRDFWIRLEPRS